MRLVATEDLTYAGRDLKAGERFDSESASDAMVLKGAGRAADAPQDDECVAQSTPSEPAPRRRYNRRDMQAEE